jgi:hypothetical protein
MWPLGEGVYGIDKWETALHFWSSFQGGEMPDLVVADVRFALDRTTPLSMLFKPDDNEIPTGLSHLKPFAVLARALGLPLGVSARTMMGRALWEAQIASSEPEKRAMGYLAVHEIGELAAILGDGAEILNGGADRRQRIDNCLKWLKNNSATEFEDGLRKAVRDYRRRLFRLLIAPDASNVFVRPSHYAELMGWCERMRENPQPLDPQHDIGLELTYHNGKRDIISLASLFADFDKITTKALEPSSYRSDKHRVAEPWKLDDDGRPRICDYLRRLGSLKTAFENAAEAVHAYRVVAPLPDNYQPLSLATLKNRHGYTALTAGLIVLFQFVRIEQNKVEQWEYSFERDSWEPRKLQFISGKIDPDNNLRRTLQKLIVLIRRYTEANDVENGDNTFTRSDLFDEFPDEWVRGISVNRGDHDREWVQWHFERLVDAHVLRHKVVAGEDSYTLNTGWRRSQSKLNAPPAPRRLPRLVAGKGVGAKDSDREPNRVQWLRLSLGYTRDDFNSVERVLGDAFGGSEINRHAGREAEKAAVKAKVGRAILNSLEKLELPFYLLDICREYATVYLKWPREKWPKWLQASSALSQEN